MCTTLYLLTPNPDHACTKPITGAFIIYFSDPTLGPSPCISDPCDVNALCTRSTVLSAEFICSCNPPFVGSGFVCSGMSMLLFVS